MVVDRNAYLFGHSLSTRGDDSMEKYGQLLILIAIICFVPSALRWFFRNGWRKIEAEVPHVAIPTFLGQPQWTSKPIKSGWHYFPLYPWLCGYINIKVQKIDASAEVKVILPADNSPVRLKYSLSFVPDSSNGEMLEAYVNIGGADGVIIKIIAETTGHIREFLTSTNYGPQAFEEVQGIQPEMAAMLFKNILDCDDETPIISLDSNHTEPAPWPTPTLLKYFSNPRGNPNAIEKKHYGEGWEDLDIKMLELRNKFPIKFEF